MCSDAARFECSVCIAIANWLAVHPGLLFSPGVVQSRCTLYLSPGANQTASLVSAVPSSPVLPNTDLPSIASSSSNKKAYTVRNRRGPFS